MEHKKKRGDWAAEKEMAWCTNSVNKTEKKMGSAQ
jgi:hypothetical protein